MDSKTDHTVDATQAALAGRVITPPTTKALPARATRPSPQTVEEARAAVELSRQRISTTLDALEARIVHGKRSIRDKLDVRLQFTEQVQRRPLAVVAVAAGLGLLLGSLGGGGDDEDDGNDRRDLKKWRKQRKKRVRARLDAYADDDDEGHDSGGGLKRQLLGVVTSAITAAAVAQAKRLAVENLQHYLAGHDDDDGNHAEDLDDPDDRPRRRPRVRRVRRDPHDMYG